MGRAARQGRSQGGGNGDRHAASRVIAISSNQELQEMDELDALAFGDHEGIGVDALAEIRDNGSLFAIRDNDGTMIG